MRMNNARDQEDIDQFEIVVSMVTQAELKIVLNTVKKNLQYFLLQFQHFSN